MLTLADVPDIPITKSKTHSGLWDKVLQKNTSRIIKIIWRILLSMRNIGN